MIRRIKLKKIADFFFGGGGMGGGWQTWLKQHALRILTKCFKISVIVIENI